MSCLLKLISFPLFPGFPVLRLQDLYFHFLPLFCPVEWIAYLLWHFFFFFFKAWGTSAKFVLWYCRALLAQCVLWLSEEQYTLNVPPVVAYKTKQQCLEPGFYKTEENLFDRIQEPDFYFSWKFQNLYGFILN